MNRPLRAAVGKRAQWRCEYCQWPGRFSELRFQLDHVIARKHRGRTNAANLAFACFRCNSHKGPNLAGIDPRTGALVRLFNPRSDRWPEHFAWRGARLRGRTAIGRATIAVLQINRPDAVLARTALVQEGVSLDPPGAE